MADINDYIQIVKLESQKDYSQLENSKGFVVETSHGVTAAIQTQAKASFISLLKFLPEVPRGNHFHLHKIEYMTVLKGRLHCKFQLEADRDEVMEAVLTSGDCVRILPRCIHTFTALGEPVLALEYSPQRFTESDVHVDEQID